MEKFPVDPNPLFADRGTDVADAMRYAISLAQSSSDTASVYTAVQVVMNTVINWVRSQSDQSDQSDQSAAADQSAADQSAADQLEAGIMTSVCAWLDKKRPDGDRSGPVRLHRRGKSGQGLA